MENKITIVLASLLLVITIFSTIFYFGRLKVTFIKWLSFNPCAISNIIFLIGFTISFFTGNKTLIYIAILPMFFRDVGYVFSPMGWYEYYSTNWPYNYDAYKFQNYQSATIGLLTGIITFSVFISIQ